MADDFTTNFLKKYGQDDTISKLVNTKPLYDPYKMASDTINQTNKEITNLLKIQSDLEERKQAAIDAQNKKLQEAQFVNDFNNYQDGLNKTIVGLETQVGRPLNDDERVRVYSTFQKQLVDGLKSVGRKDLAGEAMVRYDPKMLYSFDLNKKSLETEAAAKEAKANETGFVRHWLGDTAVQAATGFMDMIGNVEDIAGSVTGADFLSNEAKSVYKTNQDIRDALLSDRAKQDAKDVEKARAKAEADGNKVAESLSVFEDPTAIIGNLIGSVGLVGATVKGTTKLGAKAIAKELAKDEAKGLALKSTIGKAGSIGVSSLQGGGSVVNTQRQTAIQDAINAGYTQEEAEVIGDKAAEFNAQQAIGIGLGGLAGSSGAEALLFKKATDGAVKTILKDGGAEAITEALQGGQEQYSGNVASINQGLITEDQAMRGVDIAAAQGGIVGALGGGAFGGLHALTSRTPNTNITVDEVALDGTDNPPTAPAAPTVTPAQRVDLRASISENGVDGSEQLKAMAKQAGVTPVEFANQLGIIAQDADGNVTTFTDTTPDDISQKILGTDISGSKISKIHGETINTVSKINSLLKDNAELFSGVDIKSLSNDVEQAKEFLRQGVVKTQNTRNWDSQYVDEGIENIKLMNSTAKSTLSDMNERIQALKDIDAYNENPVVQPQSNIDADGVVTDQAQVDTINALNEAVAPTPVNVTQDAGKVAVEKTPADNTNYAEKGNAYEVALNDHVNNSTDGYSQPADVKKAIIVIKNSPVGGNQEVTNAVKLVESEFANRGIKLPKVNTNTAPDRFELAKQLQSAIDDKKIIGKDIAIAKKLIETLNKQYTTGEKTGTLEVSQNANAKAMQDATALLGKVNNTNDVPDAEWNEYVKTGKVTDERVQAIADKVINGETPTTKEAQMVGSDDANTRFEAILTAERAKSNNTDDNTATNSDGNLKDWIVAKFTRPKNDDGKDDSKHKVDEIPDDEKKPVTEQDAKAEVEQSKDKEQKDGSVKYDKAILVSEYDKLIAKQKQDEQDKKDVTEQPADTTVTGTANIDTAIVPDTTPVPDTTNTPANDVQTPVTDNELLTPADDDFTLEPVAPETVTPVAPKSELAEVTDKINATKAEASNKRKAVAPAKKAESKQSNDIANNLILNNKGMSRIDYLLKHPKKKDGLEFAFSYIIENTNEFMDGIIPNSARKNHNTLKDWLEKRATKLRAGMKYKEREDIVKSWRNPNDTQLKSLLKFTKEQAEAFDAKIEEQQMDALIAKSPAKAEPKVAPVKDVKQEPVKDVKQNNKPKREELIRSFEYITNDELRVGDEFSTEIDRGSSARQTSHSGIVTKINPKNVTYTSSGSIYGASTLTAKKTDLSRLIIKRDGKMYRTFRYADEAVKNLAPNLVKKSAPKVSKATKKTTVKVEPVAEVTPTDTVVEQTPVENKNQAHDVLSNEFNTLSEDEQASIRKQYRKELPYSSNEDGSKYTIWNFISEKVTEYFSNPDKFDGLSTVGEQFDWKNAIIKIGNALQNAKKAIGAIIMSVAIANGVISNDANANPVNIDTIVQNQQITNDANVVNSFVTKNKDNDGRKYIIADKKAGVMYVMNADGSLAITTPALFGEDVGDNATSGQTPAGKFKLSVVTTKQGDIYGGSVQGFTRGSFGEVYAIHRVITSNAKENRIGRLNSKTANDNRVSKGCINVPAKFYDENLDGNFDGNVYIIPETTSIDAMFGGALFSRRRKANAKKGTVKMVQDALTSMFGVKDIKDLNNVNVIKSISEFGSVADIQKAVDNGQLSVIAWHGTPHTVDKFSTDKIGTGEGAQAYGYGLYFADSRDVAEHYREDPNLKLKKLNELVKNKDLEIDKAVKDGDIMLEMRLRREKRNLNLYDINVGENKNGNVYQVELAPKENEYLLWDKPFSEQSEYVKKSINDYSLLGNKFAQKIQDENLSGQDIQKGFVSDARNRKGTAGKGIQNDGAEKEASETLLFIGIKGIKYLDGSSRSKGDGSYNYVIFSDDDVSIIAQFSRDNLDNIQGFYDPKTDEITMIAENLNSADDARAVFLHEVGHRSMKKTIGAEKWNRLHDMVSNWKDAKVGSIENDVYTKAKRSADASGETGDRLKDELIQYAVEEAYRAGIEPDAKVFNEKTVAGFMASVWRSFTNAMKKLHPNFKGYLTGKDLVNIAYGVANNDVFSDTNASQNEAIAASKKDQDAQIVEDVYKDQIKVNGTWFNAEIIFGKKASTYNVGDIAYYKDTNKNNKSNGTVEEIQSDLFRESGANVSTSDLKINEYADEMLKYGGWGDFPPIYGYVETITSDDIKKYNDFVKDGLENELNYSRVLTNDDIGKKIVIVENGHNRAYAAKKLGFPLQVIDGNKDSISMSKQDQDAEIVAQYAAEDGAPTEAQIREARQQIRDVEAKYAKELADGSWVNLTPTGKPSELTKGQWVQTRTDNFKKFFGDWEGDPANASKVVNENTGEPQVLFHGTNANISEFSSTGGLFSFTKSPEYASEYSGGGSLGGVHSEPIFIDTRNGSSYEFTDNYGEFKNTRTGDTISEKELRDMIEFGEVEITNSGSNLVPVFLSANTLDVTKKSDDVLSIVNSLDAKNNRSAIDIKKRWVENGGKLRWQDTQMEFVTKAFKDVFNPQLEALGYNGLMIKDDSSLAGNTYQVFNPNQIKSATGNSGAFDPDTADIRFSMSRDEMLAYDGVKPAQKEAILNSAKKKVQDSKDSLLKMAGAVVSKGDGLPKMTKLAMLLKGTRLANESWAFRTADMDSVVDWTKHLFNNLLAAYVRAIKTQGADVRAKIDDFHNAVGKYLFRPDIKAQHDTLSELFVGATKENYDPSGTFKTKLGATKNAKLDTLYNSLSEPAQQTYKNTLIFFRNQFNRELKAFEQSLRDAGHDDAYIDKLLSEVRKVEVYVPLRQYGNRVMSVYVRNADGSNGEALAHEFFDGKINIAFTEMRMKAEFKKMFGDNINVTQITEFREKLRPSLSASQNDVIDAHAARLRQNGLSEAEVDAQIAEFVKTLSSFGIAKLDQTKQERTGVYSSGFKRDIFRAINDVASTNEMRIASLVHKKTITDAFNAAQEHIKKESLNPDYDGLSADMALKAIRESFDYRASNDGLQGFVTKINGFGFLATMGFDMSQIPLQLSSLMNLSLPHLVSRFPKDKAFATKQMGKNFYAVLKMVRYGGMNEYLNVLSEKASKGDSEAKKLFDSLKPAYEQMRANDRVSFTDLKEIENEIYGKTNLMSNILRYSGMQLNITEQVVNMSIAMTTIQLAEKNGMNQSEIDFQVDEALRRGNPNSTPTTKGFYSKTAIGRFFTIMRSYGMAVFVRQMSDLRTVWRLKGTGSTDFKEARNRLVATIVIQGTMAGAVGMPTFLTFPLWIMLSVAKAMTADDDEEELTTDQWTRKIFYETFGSDATRVMRYGMLSFVGGDALAKRMSFDDLIVRNTDDDLNGDGIRDYMDDLSANAPLTGGVTDRSVRAFSRFYNDIKAGRPMDDVFDELLRKNLPMKSINSIAKAYDAMQNDGQVYSKDNTPLLSEKNKLNILERVAMALGIRPAMVMEAQNNKWELISAKMEKEQQKKAMLDNYKIVYAQFKQGIADQSDVDDAKEMIDEYNAKNPLYEISAKSIANAQKKLTVNMENSIITPRNKTDKAKIDEVINSNPWLNPEEEL